MNPNRLLLLQAELELMDKAREHLRYSYERCQAIVGKASYTLEELEHFESLTSRFARLSDLLIQKLFRLIDQLDLDESGTIRDRINRAEKKGLIADADRFVEIRELRNQIAHEYNPNAMLTIFTEVLHYCPPLFDAVERVHRYSSQYLTD
ncbi:hypothetical protein THII_0454 [Thioploca ingrica]|uniref:DUF86 domain-containing protein n=1 Tax=Thioploca ingrica TaxID=40754 RepID=A0A090BUA2_9GAMM|nr:hypothetical protein THII_0454 [Thioploca ingrica]